MWKGDSQNRKNQRIPKSRDLMLLAICIVSGVFTCQTRVNSSFYQFVKFESPEGDKFEE